MKTTPYPQILSSLLLLIIFISCSSSQHSANTKTVDGRVSSTKEHSLSKPDAVKADSGHYTKIIYLIPKDKPYRENWHKLLTNWALNMQQWFKDHTADSSTFHFDPDELIVDTLRAKYNLEWFLPPEQKKDKNYYTLYRVNKYIIDNVEGTGDKSKPFKIFADIGKPSPRQDGAALHHIAITYMGGLSPDATEPPSNAWIGCTGHELGHALGLPHPTHKYLKGYIMGRCRAFPDVKLHPVNQERAKKSKYFY